ncbi:MAG: tripartite tricarboxylate transporter substrate binding protein [Betaproteobacteria bacterium]|nr:tripartite tricarboxylate transporter substrate binding protein [Betaproteobacteria bacterium]
MNAACKLFGLLFALALASGEATAQSYPTKPIRFIVPYAPGGTDVIARIIAQPLGERLGQTVIIENKPGAESVIGTDYVAKSAPDGYTLLLGGASMIYNYALFEKLPFDTLKDLIPITEIANDALVVAAHPSLPVASMKDLIAMAKSKPGGLFYAWGATSMKIGMEFFKKREGLDIVSVAYKGSGPAVTAAMAGEVPLVIVSIVPALAQMKAGKLRALAITGPKRSPFLPDVPTMTESGVDLDGGMWIGVFAPAGTPTVVIDKFYGELAVVLKSEGLKQRYAAIGYGTYGIGMPPAELQASFRSSIEKWTKVIKDLGITR